MRDWTAAALAGQKQIAARLSREGIQLVPDFVYTRTFNGFAAPIDGRALALLERDRDVAGVYPVRAAYPASLSADELRSQAFEPRRRPATGAAGIPGFDGSGVTVALLDTGIDVTPSVHPGPAARGSRHARPGRPRHCAAASRRFDAARAPRHADGGTDRRAWRPGRYPGCRARRVDPADQSRRLAAERRRRLRRLRPHRPVARRPRAGGRPGRRRRRPGRRAYCGRRRHRAVRLLRGRAVALAVAGAAELDTLVVAPAGNEGPAGPDYGSIGGPGGAPAALTVGAADLRRETATVRVVVRPACRSFSIGSSRWAARRRRARR